MLLSKETLFPADDAGKEKKGGEGDANHSRRTGAVVAAWAMEQDHTARPMLLPGMVWRNEGIGSLSYQCF